MHFIGGPGVLYTTCAFITTWVGTQKIVAADRSGCPRHVHVNCGMQSSSRTKHFSCRFLAARAAVRHKT